MANSKKCEYCMKVKEYRLYNKTPFTDDGYEIYCRKCRDEKLIKNEKDFINYLREHNIKYNKECWESASDYVYQREVKKYKKDDLPEDFEDIIFAKAYKQYLRYSNLEGRFKAVALDQKEVKSLMESRKEKTEKFYSQKWMGYYTEEDIQYLDEYLLDLERDYTIETRNHKDYAMKIAQTSLYMNQVYQQLLNNDKGAQVAYKSARENFDKLCESAKFSEKTRSQNDVGMGSIAKIIEMVEAGHYIPQHIPVEKDDIEVIIEGLNHTEKSL